MDNGADWRLQQVSGFAGNDSRMEEGEADSRLPPGSAEDSAVPSTQPRNDAEGSQTSAAEEATSTVEGSLDTGAIAEVDSEAVGSELADREYVVQRKRNAPRAFARGIVGVETWASATPTSGDCSPGYAESGGNERGVGQRVEDVGRLDGVQQPHSQEALSGVKASRTLDIPRGYEIFRSSMACAILPISGCPLVSGHHFLYDTKDSIGILLH